MIFLPTLGLADVQDMEISAIGTTFESATPNNAPKDCLGANNVLMADAHQR